MGIKSRIISGFAAYTRRRIARDASRAVQHQAETFRTLLRKGAQTEFGRQHQFHHITDHAQWITKVPIRDYEDMRPYIDKIIAGGDNILWPGKPIYFAKTSGTTSGVKYIPISKDSISNHISSARNALLCYVAESGNAAFADGKMIFLSGSPELERVGGIPTGRLSGIVNHHIPYYLRKNQLPSYETNCIEDWEKKLDKILEETVNQDLTLISGIPPWMQMYFDRLIQLKKKKIGDIFPNLKVIVHGGVNFEPYKARLFESIGRPVACIETFPASEGFIAFQDSAHHEGLLLNTNSGIYFEFIPAGEIFKDNARRLSLRDVKVGENYALIINNNAASGDIISVIP